MSLAESLISNSYSIQAYERDQITINDKVYTDSLVLSPDRLIEQWPVNSVSQLETEHLQCIFDMRPDVILLGTGDKQIFPDMHILGYFAQRGFGVEVMNTGALCRTYNILVAEGRHVAAAFILEIN